MTTVWRPPPNVLVLSANIGIAPYLDQVPHGMGSSPFPLNVVMDSEPGNRRNFPDSDSRMGIRLAIRSGHEFDPKHIDSFMVSSWPGSHSVLCDENVDPNYRQCA